MPKSSFARPGALATPRGLKQERKQSLARRREIILETRIDGYEHDQIAARFDVSVKSPRREIDRMFDERGQAARQSYVNLQLARDDKIIALVIDAMNEDNLATAPPPFQAQAPYDFYEGQESLFVRRGSKFPKGPFSAPKALTPLDREFETGALLKALDPATEVSEPGQSLPVLAKGPAWSAAGVSSP